MRCEYYKNGNDQMDLTIKCQWHLLKVSRIFFSSRNFSCEPTLGVILNETVLF